MMHTRTTLLALLAAGALVALPGAALAAPTATSTKKAAKRTPLAATLTGCVVDPAARGATFKGQMPATRGLTGRMEMRFELFQRPLNGPKWTRIAVPTFGVWDASAAGVSGFIVTKNVAALQPGFAYRATVRYRWRDAKGRVRRQTKRVTHGCQQPDTRADLLLRKPTVTAGARSDLLLYTFVVRNLGAGPVTAPFDVVLQVNGAALTPQTVNPPLPVGGRVFVTFEGPRCTPGSVVRATVDAQAAIAETDEANNVFEATCRAA